MKNTELIAVVREDYLDDVPDIAVPTAADYRWSSAFILRNLNQGEREAADRGNLFFDDSTTSICSIALVDGTALYSLDRRIKRVVRCVFDNLTLKHTTERALDADYAGWRDYESGVPKQFVTYADRTIRFVPAPGADQDAENATLDVYRLPLRDMRNDSLWEASTVTAAASYIHNGNGFYFYTVAGGTTHSSAPTWDETEGNSTTDNDITWVCQGVYKDEPEIDLMYHEDLCWWVRHKAQRRPDEDTQSDKEAAGALAEFVRIFGSAVGADVRRHELESPKSLQLKAAVGYSDSPSDAELYADQRIW